MPAHPRRGHGSAPPARRIAWPAFQRHHPTDPFPLGSHARVAVLPRGRQPDDRVAIAYMPDHAPISLGPGPEQHGPYHETAVQLTQGVDVLLHDSQSTREEFPARAHFGHSSIDYAVGLAGTRRSAAAGPLPSRPMAVGRATRQHRRELGRGLRAGDRGGRVGRARRWRYCREDMTGRQPGRGESAPTRAL